MQPTYNEVFTYSNLIASAERCIKNVSWKQSVQHFTLNMYTVCAKLFHQLNERRYQSKGFTTFFITERGKVRKIQSVHISERVVQKTLCTYALKPIITPSLIYDNAASLKDRGQDFAIKRFREHLRWHYAHYGKQGGILICDYHNFFGSIDHKILLNMLEKRIKDKELFTITKYFIDCFKGGKGLGLGSEISQICAIYYPNRLDHTIKEKYRIHGYGRYMDDFYVICEDIDRLKEILETVRTISTELRLTLNEKHTNIYKFSDDPVFSFLKCRTRLEDTGKICMRLTQGNVKRRKHWLKKQRELLDEGKIDYAYVKQSEQTWKSYAKRRKRSYHSMQSVTKYYNSIFPEEVMTEKELVKEIKRTNQKLYYIQQDISKIMQAQRIDHDTIKRIEASIPDKNDK